MTDSRDIEILDAVVRLNIETGRPVSSDLVARMLQRAYSSAAIRVVMKRLEDEGYLVKPHTSAGRLPTDLGYRGFVDRALAVERLRPWHAPRQIQQSLEADLQRSLNSGSVVKVLAKLLSRLSANISIILGPSWEAVRAVRLDLYPKDSQRVLLVMVLEHALVRSGLVKLDKAYSPQILAEAASILSERIHGRTLSEIRQGVVPSLSGTDSPAEKCATDLAQRSRDLFDDVEEGEIELEGVSNVLNEPEFSDPAPLKALIRFLESPRIIREALQRLSPADEKSIAVWIGAENPIGDLREFSLLSSQFVVGDRYGILAVLGPRRMPYQRAFTGIDVLRRSLHYIA